MTSAPAFQFYAHDFLAGRVATYSLEEVGAYIMLLSFDWSLNGLPKEAENLAKLCRISPRKFRVLWAKISDQFEERDGKLYNPRLAKERQKQELWRAKSAEGGRKSAEGRGKGGSRVVQPPRQPKGNTPTPSPTPSPTKTTAALRAPDVDFVIEHYIAKHPRSRPGDGSRKAIVRALGRGYSREELCLAVDGNASDDWCVREAVFGLDFVMSEKRLDGFISKGTPVRLVDDNGLLTPEGAARLGKAS